MIGPLFLFFGIALLGIAITIKKLLRPRPWASRDHVSAPASKPYLF